MLDAGLSAASLTRTAIVNGSRQAGFTRRRPAARGPRSARHDQPSAARETSSAYRPGATAGSVNRVTVGVEGFAIAMFAAALVAATPRSPISTPPPIAEAGSSPSTTRPFRSVHVEDSLFTSISDVRYPAASQRARRQPAGSFASPSLLLTGSAEAGSRHSADASATGFQSASAILSAAEASRAATRAKAALTRAVPIGDRMGSPPRGILPPNLRRRSGRKRAPAVAPGAPD